MRAARSQAAAKTIRLRSLNDFDEWRAAARGLLLAGIAPDAVNWAAPGDADDLFASATEDAPLMTNRAAGVVPQKFLALGAEAICHTDQDRFALLYRLLWRLQKDGSVLTVLSDPDVGKLQRRVSAVRRDAHKMTAFVRFRAVPGGDGRERFAAWFEPEHYVLERTAPFFVRRFAAMDWAILTPYSSALWDGETLRFAPGAQKADVPSDDALEPAWRTYFASIFNPARLKVRAMQAEMPKKYWRNLPEAELIAPLIRGAKKAEQEMIARAATQPPRRHLKQALRTPEAPPTAGIVSLADARAEVQGCRRCPLYEHATQAVFGEGPETAEIMFVGEQPGDQEDLSGKPFVGPAGKVFDTALGRAGIDRARVYVTNAVKHFKFVPRGKRRLHQKPNGGEIAACRFWLELERELVRPRIIVALGATAVQSLMGKATSIASMRGEPHELDDGTVLFVTVHPSYLLRIRVGDGADADLEREKFEDDLRRVRAFADGTGPAPAAPAA